MSCWIKKDDNWVLLLYDDDDGWLLFYGVDYDGVIKWHKRQLIANELNDDKRLIDFWKLLLLLLFDKT